MEGLDAGMIGYGGAGTGGSEQPIQSQIGWKISENLELLIENFINFGTFNRKFWKFRNFLL